jgi:hypothetical protein
VDADNHIKAFQCPHPAKAHKMDIKTRLLTLFENLPTATATELQTSDSLGLGAAPPTSYMGMGAMVAAGHGPSLPLAPLKVQRRHFCATQRHELAKQSKHFMIFEQARKKA